MSKLIKNWEELAQVPANDKYRIIVDKEMCSGWIVPIWDEFDEDHDFKCNCNKCNCSYLNFYEHHVYLSTHTFYGGTYKHSTKVLQEHGFDVEIDNWDKGENDG